MHASESQCPKHFAKAHTWLPGHAGDLLACDDVVVLKYHGGEVPGKAAGTLRDKPYSDDLLQPEAPLATLFLEWVGENFPGWPTKTNKLVRCHFAFQTGCSTQNTAF